MEDILGNRDTSVSGSIYYYSERGDRLIDLSSFSNKLWQVCSCNNGHQIFSLMNINVSPVINIYADSFVCSETTFWISPSR